LYDGIELGRSDGRLDGCVDGCVDGLEDVVGLPEGALLLSTVGSRDEVGCVEG